MTHLKCARILTACAFTLLSVRAGEARTVVLDASGWRVEADADSGTLAVSRNGLGLVLDRVKFSLPASEGSNEISGWSIEKKADELLLRSASSALTLVVQPQPEFIAFSTTAPEIVLRGQAPAGKDRIVARTLDPGGFPVTWQGTSEVKREYGGTKTQFRSYLPRGNSDVMYFAIGQVAGPMFHSLFDRNTDTIIDYGATAVLTDEPGSEGELAVAIKIPSNASIRIVPDYFTKVLGLPFYKPFDDSYFKTAPMVWSSWTSYYEGVTENDIVKNADWLSANLKPYGFEYVQLDDGYDRGPSGEHAWIDPWNKAKFPHGAQWLTSYIRSKGLRAGLWLVPNSYSGGVKEHPEWYLRTKEGKLINDYSTPAMDSSNPAVMAFVQHLFRTLDDWGFDYYKLDGEFALPKYAPAVDKGKLYDGKADPVEIYRRRLAVIRETVGPNRFLEGCPSGAPLNGIGYVNSYFTEDDLFANWQGMYPLFASISANAFLNHLAVYIMPGEGLELGEKMTVEEARQKRRPVVVQQLHGREDPLTGVGTSVAETRTVLSYIALTGVTYPLASVMAEVPPERVAMLKATMPTQAILPSDLFSRGTDMEWNTFQLVRLTDYVHTYPQILDLKVNGVLGRYDVVGITNWTQAQTSPRLSFDSKLGLNAKLPYLVFDFWNEKFLGSFEGDLPVDITPHDTRVLLIHPQTDHPQVLGTSRHITGFYSLESVAWNKASHILSGSSQSVASDPYRLWIHVPGRAFPKNVSATTTDGKPVEIQQQRDGELLTLSFTGVASPVNWKVNF